MSFLKPILKIFKPKPDITKMADRGMYYFIKCKRCGEVIRIRIDPMNDLSWDDSNTALFVRKTIVGRRCYSRIEAEFTYDKDRNLTHSEVESGTLVDRDAYDADQAAHPENKPS